MQQNQTTKGAFTAVFEVVSVVVTPAPCEINITSALLCEDGCVMTGGVTPHSGDISAAGDG